MISMAGMFYVIEGFLDIILPTTESLTEHAADGKFASTQQSHTRMTSGPTSQQYMRQEREDAQRGRQDRDDPGAKHLFTVKPGGIAGYLCEWSLLLRSSPC
jgi:lysophospholipid hydrolase